MRRRCMSTDTRILFEFVTCLIAHAITGIHVHSDGHGPRRNCGMRAYAVRSGGGHAWLQGVRDLTALR